MIPSLPALSLLVANLLVSAPGAISQDLSGLPACALSCSETAYNAINKACAQTDFACLCKNQEFVRASSSCYQSSCPADQLPKAVEFGTKTCAQVGINIATNATATAVGNAANVTANVSASVAGAAGRVANSTSSNSPVINNGSASTNSQNSSGNPAARSTFSLLIISSALASLIM